MNAFYIAPCTIWVLQQPASQPKKQSNEAPNGKADPVLKNGVEFLQQFNGAIICSKTMHYDQLERSKPLNLPQPDMGTETWLSLYSIVKYVQ